MNFDKWHVAGATLATVLTTLVIGWLNAHQINVAENMLTTLVSGAGLTAVIGGAALAVIKKKRDGN